MHIGVVSLTGTMLVFSFPESMWPSAWIAVMVCLSVAMAYLGYRYNHTKLTEAKVNRLAWAHTILTGLVGITWGAGALGLAQANYETLLIYTLALGGTALGAVSSQHAVPRSCFVSIMTSTLLLAAAHVVHKPDIFGAVSGGMILLYAIILSILSLRMYRFVAANTKLNTRLDEKVAELTVLTEDLEIARRAAEAANASKSRFLAQASHDLRQPIHAVALFAACLTDARLTDEERRMLAAIDDSLESVSRLFNSLLDISRLDSGGVTSSPEPVAIGPLIDTVVRQYGVMALEKGVEITVVKSRLWVSADPALMTTLVHNLVSNGIKYGSDRLLIGVRRRNGRLRLEVCDNGAGIPAAEIDKIFEEFMRLDSASGVEGLGLGLAIVRRLAALMSLQVAIRSEPGRGTIASVDGLELVPPRETQRTQSVPKHPLFGKKICVIDDDPEVLDATAGLLERWGCIVSSHHGLPLDKADYDAIICDYHLGGGLRAPTAISAIRKVAARPVPALVVSGYLDAEIQQTCAKQNLPFLAKPVLPAELRAALTGFMLSTTQEEKPDANA